jgi:hypothetical protein
MRLSPRSSAARAALLLLVASTTLLAGACSGSGSSGGSGGQGGDAAAAKLFPTNFEGVCQGATTSKAKAYDKAAKTHKVLYFETYKDKLLDQSSQLPADWTVQFDANSDAYANVDLVACAVRSSSTFVKDCDGYTKDDKPTSNKVKMNDAVYAVSVHEATTGKELAKTELTGTSNTCPMLQSFDGDNQTVDVYASPAKDALLAFVKPFVQPT